MATTQSQDLEKGVSKSTESRNYQQSTTTTNQVSSRRATSPHSTKSHLEPSDDEEKHDHDPDKNDTTPASALESSLPTDTDIDRFQVRFEPDVDNDPLSARTLPFWRKWTIVIIGSSCSLCVTCASALYTSTYPQLEQEFHVSREVATVGLTTYVCGLGLGPLFLSPLSEFYGRRLIYLVAFGMFFVWLIPCAVAQNIQTMLVVRFIDGLAGSAFLSVAGGTVGDMFDSKTLSLPMMVYTASPFVGPQIGPVIGGFIDQFSNWRWCFWVLVIWSGVLELVLFFFVPETYAPAVLRSKAIAKRKETGDDRWYAPIERMDKSVGKTVLWSCIRPFQLLFFEQMVLNLCLLSAILLGILYLFFGAFAVVFQNNHGFNQWQTGLTFLSIFVGMILGVFCDLIWRKKYANLVANNGGISEPEFRLPPTIAGAMIVPVSLFGFGWTTFPWVHWIVPLIFSALFGFGNILCFSGIFTFLVESYPLYAASALGANSFARSCFAAAFPLFGVQMYTNLGYQWASSVLGFIALAMAPFPLIFFKYGKRIRGRSKYAQASM